MKGSASKSHDSLEVPLCVALEGGLVPNKLETEAALQRLKARRWQHPGDRLGYGIQTVSRMSVTHDPRFLPYHSGILDAVSEARYIGRRTVLVSAGGAEPAQAVAEYLGLFDEVIAPGSSSHEALANALQDRFGPAGFDFIASRRAWSWLNSLTRTMRIAETPCSMPWWHSVGRALRAHQWLKNLLVFVPVLAGQRLTDGPVLLNATLAFCAFSLVASSVYVVNDVLDLAEDRKHSSKRRRPFASGALPLSAAPLLSGVTFGGGMLIAGTLLPVRFLVTLILYFIVTSAYTVKLKGAVLIDVLTLAALYVLRVVGGSAATGITASVWLLGFSLFFFMSLALVKRYVELHATMAGEEGAQEGHLVGRSYQPRDLPVLIAFGVGTGCIATLVLALYVINNEVARHYRNPWMLWLLCPLSLYWIGRAWIVVARDEMNDDPVIWAVKDQMSRWVGVLAILILLLAQ